MKTELDLHGIKHGDVSRKLDAFLFEHINRGTNELEVITGISPKMKEVVREVLKDYGMTATDKWGNIGSLIVNMK